MKPKALSIYILLTFTILSGCLLDREPITSSLPTVTATLKIVNSPSSTEADSSTMTPSVNTPPFIFTPVQTLEATDAFVLLRDYLNNNPPCQLPCWWGITPGKSTLADVQKQLTVFSGISNRIYFGEAGDFWIVGNLDIHYPEEDTLIDIRSAYLTLSDEETILRVSINTQSLPQNPVGRLYGDKNYNELLSAYTLSQILTTYGIPDQIFVTAEIYVAEPNAPDYFKIRLMYPDLGIFMTYTMPTQTDENIHKFCPSDSVIDLELIPQGFGDNYQEFFRQLGNDEWDSIPDPPFDKSTDEALGITNEEFYQLFRSSTSQCLESPISIWPEP